jgi:sugar lactone lactonase YvrE
MSAPESFFRGLDFGEGPRWHEGRLWVSDFYANSVRSFGPTGDARVEVLLDDQPSGLGWLPSGELLVVAMTSKQVRRVGLDGDVVLHADLSSIATGICNDMVVAPSGIAYVGNFGFDADDPGAGIRNARLAMVRPDGSTSVAAEEMQFPNGSVIAPDGRTLIVGESIGARYTAFTIDGDGALSDRRTWAETPGRAPDGCALDEEGAIWMADVATGDCFRIAEGGDVLGHVSASQPIFACALGGEDRRDLYLITAPAFGAAPCAGKGLGTIEVIRVDVPGAGWP